MKPIFAFLLSVALIVPASVHAADSRMAGSVPVSAKTLERQEAKKAAAAAAAKEKAAAKKEAKISKPVIEDKDETRQAAQKAAEDQAQDDADDPKAPAIKVSGPINFVGDIETYKARSDDTLLTIAERNGLGYVELRSANPAMDPWRPGSGTYIILPKMHLLPDAPRKGIVVNLSEMRMYYFPKEGPIRSFPIGVGREGFSTPMGSTTVVRKVVGPVWRPTDRMRKEDPSLPVQITAGPDNPLGTHALYLGWPQYLLHGTNKPWGIGRRVSSGCVRMYNQDAEALYSMVPVGTSVQVVRQPIKFGWIGDMLYIEAHPDEMLADQVERVGAAQDYKVPEDIFANLSRAAGEKRDRVDWKAVQTALKDRRGYPVPILTGATPEHYFVTAAMENRAGTSRFRQHLTQELPAPMPLTATSATAGGTQEAEAPARRRKVGFNG